MKKIKLLLILFTSLLLVACGNKKEREYIDIPYLQKEAIDNLDSYLEDKNINNKNENIVKESKGKFIRWTASVKKINSDKKITLQEQGLPLIEVKLNDKVLNDIKDGDIITVSGTLDKYEHGLFVITPKWKIDDGIILETSEKDTQNILDYQSAYSNAVKAKTKEQYEKSPVTNINQENKSIPKFEIVSTVDYAHNSLIFHVETDAKNMEELEKVVRLIYDSEKKDIVSRDAIDIYFYPIGTLEFNSDAIFAESAMAFTKIGRAQTLLESIYTFSITINNTPEKKIFNL